LITQIAIQLFSSCSENPLKNPEEVPPKLSLPELLEGREKLISIADVAGCSFIRSYESLGCRPDLTAQYSIF